MQSMYGTGFVNGYVDGTRINLFSRTAEGRLQTTQVPAEWVVYFKEGELPEDLQRQLLRSTRVTSARREEGGWLRIAFNDPKLRRFLCFDKRSRDGIENPILARGIQHYEGDVDPIRRFFTDSGASIARPKRVYLDIETDSRVPFSRKEEMRVLSWALVDHESGRAQLDVLAEDGDGAERDLLGRMWEALEDYDQVSAWYGDGFDFPVIFARSEHANIKRDVRRLLYVDQMALFERMNKHAAESGEEKQSMALQNIGMATVGEGKEATPPWVVERFGNKSLGALSWELWQAGGKYRALLLRYMLKDTELLRKIEKKTGYMELFATLCEVCRLFGSTESLNPTRQMDGFMLRLAQERQHHFPSREHREEQDDQFKGAFVMQPKTISEAWKQEHPDGFARNVHVADFASLYPSIYLTWNMSADTKEPNAPVNGPIPDGLCRSPSTGVSFRTGEKGLLPIALSELIRMRKHWNDLKASLPPGTTEWYDADRRSMAYKVAANSFYGVTGSPFSRYFDRQIAESCTQNGVWLIRQTIAAAEQRGWNTIYGDTDSVFVAGCTREEFAAFVDWCNKELYPGLLKSVGCKENHIKLAYEKAFERIVFTSAKRYVGRYSHYKGKEARADSKPEVKGLEFKRGDTTLLARRMQQDVVNLMMSGGEDLEQYHAILTRGRTHILEDALPIDEVKLSKGLSKGLKEYAVKMKTDGTEGAPLPHVVVARMLEARGQDVSQGTRIEYVVVNENADAPTERVIPADDYKGECDRHYVWQSLVYPPTQRLLEAAFPHAKEHWDAWAKSRPPTPRGRAAKAEAEGQERLFAAPETRVSVPAAPAASTGAPSVPAMPKRSEATYEALVEERCIARGMRPVYDVCSKHPGKRPLVLRVKLSTGAEATLDTALKVDGSAALARELAEFRSRPSAA